MSKYTEKILHELASSTDPDRNRDNIVTLLAYLCSEVERISLPKGQIRYDIPPAPGDLIPINEAVITLRNR